MIVAISKDATAEQIQNVVAGIVQHGLQPIEMPGGDRVAVGIASAIPADLREPLTQILEIMPGVDHAALKPGRDQRLSSIRPITSSGLIQMT